MAPLVAHPPQREVRESVDARGSFDAVYRTYVRDVYAFALSMVGNAEDAEDVAQTTFLNAYRALEGGERVRNLRAWLLAIAHNVCRQRFRTAARRPQQVELDPEAAEAFVDEDAPSAQEIRHAMDQLSFNQRTILVLREIEGLSYEEIAQAMDLSLSAVETLLFRARQALREQLEAAEHDLGCDSIQRLISLQLDGKLARQDKGLLRAHLRTCAECSRFARSQRARKRVMPSLLAVPLPAGLSGAFQAGGFGAAGLSGAVQAGGFVAAGLATSKVAALAVSAILVGTGTLVELGVVPAPAKADEARAERVMAAADAIAEEQPSSVASLLEFGAPRAGARFGGQLVASPGGRKAVERVKKDRGSRAQAPSGGGAPPAANSSGAGAQTTSGGGTTAPSSGGGAGLPNISGGGGTLPDLAGGSTPLPPAPPAPAPSDVVSGATGAVGGAVGGTAGGAVGGTVGGTVGGVVGGVESNVPSPPASPVETPSLPPVPLPGTGPLP